MSDDLLLRVQLDANYAGRSVLRDVRLELEHGEVLGLVGSSGAGKSTLVLSLLGLLPWRGGRVTGEVLLQGENLLYMPERQLRALRGRAVGFIPQSPVSALNPALSLERHFKEAWRAHQRMAGDALAERMRTQRELLLLEHEYWLRAVRDAELHERYVERHRSTRSGVCGYDPG